MKNGYGQIIGLVAAIVIVLGVYLLGALAIPDSTPIDTATAMGITEINVSERSYAFGPISGCDKLDIVKWTVSGKTGSGQHVTFRVCGSFLRGGTAHF